LLFESLAREILTKTHTMKKEEEKRKKVQFNLPKPLEKYFNYG